MVRHRFGRPSGNALLRSIIQPLVSRLRRTDCIGRLGGTQFTVLLTSTTEAKALRATEEMQREMEQTNTKIFFDVGYCEISEGMGICDDWLKQADIILLDAKTAGRNEIDEDSDRQYDLVS